MEKKVTGILLKFGALEYMTSLLKEGVVFCNTLHFFAKVDDNNVRGDKFENCTDIENFNELRMIMKSLDKKTTLFDGIVQNPQLRQFYNQESTVGNIYSTYFLEFSSLTLNKKVTLGITDADIDEWCVVIMNSELFMKLLNEKIAEKGLESKSSLVTYSDFNKIETKIKRTPFMKHLSYKGQKEFRVYIKNPINDVIIFKLGDLTPYAFMVKTSDIKRSTIHKYIKDGCEWIMLDIITDKGTTQISQQDIKYF